MSDRVTRLETHFEYIRRDLHEIKSDQKAMATELHTVNNRMSSLPTKTSLWTMIASVLGISIAIISFFVAALTYIQQSG